LINTETCTPLPKKEFERRANVFETIKNGSELTANGVKLYPNPAQEKLYIEFENEENESAEFVLYDITGKIIFEISLKSNTKTTELNNLGVVNGIYFYRILNKDGVIQQGKLNIIK
ncbi:MAG: T9SS type A sorting domain-containing protein, partial [Bacteroidia bacterium]|nr:T9SS type A sorting domain-containing protein [Bacteroidia bacterium]